jgi:hypothetical protein
MKKAIRYGLFFLATASPAIADPHYVEVWNPPEAHGGMRPAPPVRTTPRHHHTNVHIARAQLHHRVVAAVPGPKASVAAVGHRAHAPRYEDIPRQVTPEGNILRVDGRRAQAGVQR